MQKRLVTTATAVIKLSLTSNENLQLLWSYRFDVVMFVLMVIYLSDICVRVCVHTCVCVCLKALLTEKSSVWCIHLPAWRMCFDQSHDPLMNAQSLLS